MLEGPVAPVDPNAPVDPVGPVAPVAPVNPVAPVEPITPLAPVTPVAPVAPGGPPEGPVAPVAPIISVSALYPKPYKSTQYAVVPSNVYLYTLSVDVSYQISPTVGLVGVVGELVVLTPPAIIFPAFIFPETPNPPSTTIDPVETFALDKPALAKTLPFAVVYVRYCAPPALPALL